MHHDVGREKAKSVDGDLCQCIQIINSFKW